MVKQLSRAERRAVEQFRARMAETRGHAVDFDEALAEWEAHHAQQWREKRHAHMLALEREEILRHKWIESEKGNRDLGAEAVFDWIRRYAAIWRDWFDREYDGGV